MSARRVTVEDVARHAGVSIATVSRTVNGTAPVAEETLQRVRRAVDELGFRPNPAAQNLRQQRTRTVALVTPTMLNPFFPELVAGVHPELRARGYSLLVIDAQEPEREAVRAAESRVADGILLVATTGEERRSLRTPRDVPMVAIDRRPSMLAVDLVQCDNETGARAVVEHLLEIGHTRIAHLSGPAGLDVADERARGYRAALADARRHGRATSAPAVDGDLVVEGRFDEDSGFAAATTLLSAPEPPTAIFAANDLMAIGAIAAAHELGLRVPQDVAVAGFDGIHVGRYTHPTLTTFEQPFGDLARRAAERLVDAVESADRTRGPAVEPSVTRLPGHLVVRGSTVPAASTRRGDPPAPGDPAPHAEPTPTGAPR